MLAFVFFSTLFTLQIKSILMKRKNRLKINSFSKSESNLCRFVTGSDMFPICVRFLWKKKKNPSQIRCVSLQMCCYKRILRRKLANISLGIPACAKRISALNDFVLLDRFKDDRRFPNETWTRTASKCSSLFRSRVRIYGVTRAILCAVQTRLAPHAKHTKRR